MSIIRLTSLLLLLLVALLCLTPTSAQSEVVEEAVVNTKEADAAHVAFAGGGSNEHAEDHPMHVATHLPFAGAFVASISMIVVSEFGDKTFFIAAIMAMKQSRTEVFLSAMTALILMTILSAAMGLTLPHLLDPKLTAVAATILFFFFGVKLLYDAYQMDPKADSKEEIDEVEEELEKALDTEATLLENGGQTPSNSHSQKPLNKLHTRHLKSLARRFFSPVFIQCFTMTFLAEWGDRSQIATIALAAAKNPIGVSVGAIAGHSLCTGVAVLGGKLLASRISERTISIVGGLLFLVFAIHSIVSREVKMY